MKNKKTTIDSIQSEGLQLSHFTDKRPNLTLGLSENFLCSHLTSAKIKCGVPQGSTCNPFLFTMTFPPHLFCFLLLLIY